MGYKIGIDFGTTNSTVSYVNETNRLEAFRYPGPEGYEYIPTCVAYEDDTIHIGRAAQDLAGYDEAVFCNNLKMILPLSENDRTKYKWTEFKSPEQVITDYLECILCIEDEEASSFKIQKGEIEGIVLSVPHVWDKGMYQEGRTRLQSVIKDKLDLNLIQLISEPVAAAAYYAYTYQQEDSKAFRGNVLICDMGGGTFDVTLCRVEPGKVEELHNDGNGRFNLGKAGVRFDQHLILEGAKKRGQAIEENSSEFYEIYTGLQEYKANHHQNITKGIIAAIEDPELKRPILRAGKTGFDLDDIQDAFQEIETGIRDVLTRFKQATDEKKYDIDAIFFVGGFSQFYLVRETIKKMLDIGQKDTRYIKDEKREISRFAISYGAALIANDLISVEEKYEHTIGIEGYKLIEKGGMLTKEFVAIPVIQGGKKLSEYENIHFANCRVKVHHECPDVVIFVDPESKNHIVKEKLPESLNISLPNTHIPQNEWKVGMRIDKSKLVYLIFEDKYGERTEYGLGDILRQMFGGLEILQEGA